MARASRWLPIAGILALAALAIACGGPSDQATTQPLTSSPVPTPPPSPSPPRVLVVVSPTSESPSDAERRAAVDAATRDAIGRLGLSSAASDVRVQQVEPREWPDSSLGCPQKDEMYSQIVTPGFVVVLSAAGKQLEYHADTRGSVVFCKEL